MVYDDAAVSQLDMLEEERQTEDKSQLLVAVFGLHVDDILGCSDAENPRWKAFHDGLRKTFNFRTWGEATPAQGLEYTAVP